MLDEWIALLRCWGRLRDWCRCGHPYQMRKVTEQDDLRSSITGRLHNEFWKALGTFSPLKKKKLLPAALTSWFSPFSHSFNEQWSVLWLVVSLNSLNWYVFIAIFSGPELFVTVLQKWTKRAHSTCPTNQCEETKMETVKWNRNLSY